MSELLQQALRGVDPAQSGAFWRILHNLLALVPWESLFWFTAACVAVGAVIGWWRGRIASAVVLALVVGPIGWIALWALPPGRYGPARRRLDARAAQADGRAGSPHLQTPPRVPR